MLITLLALAIQMTQWCSRQLAENSKLPARAAHGHVTTWLVAGTSKHTCCVVELQQQGRHYTMYDTTRKKHSRGK